MTITHTTPEEVIKAQQATIDQLRATNATLTALALKLQTTDLAPAEIAQTLIAGCPDWIEVTAELLAARIMSEAPAPASFDQMCVTFDRLSDDDKFAFARYALTKIRN